MCYPNPNEICMSEGIVNLQVIVILCTLHKCNFELKKGEIWNILPYCELIALSVRKLHFIWLDKKTIFLGDLSFLMRHYFVPEKSTQMLFSRLTNVTVSWDNMGQTYVFCSEIRKLAIMILQQIKYKQIPKWVHCGKKTGFGNFSLQLSNPHYFIILKP